MALIAKANVVISGFEVGTSQFAPHAFTESFCFLKAGGKKEDEVDPKSMEKAKAYIDETIQT